MLEAALAETRGADKICSHEIPAVHLLIMERPYIQNPFPPPPRRIGAALLFFSVAAIALAGCGYLIWALVVPETTPVLSAARPTGAAQSEIATMVAQLGIFRKSVGRYPTAKEGLDALVERPLDLPPEALWPKLRKDLPRDPWGNRYIYEPTPGDPPGYRVYSTGADTTDPADDISQTLPAIPPDETSTPPPTPASAPKFR